MATIVYKKQQIQSMSDEISTKLRVILEKKLSDEKERGESSK